MRYWYQNNKVVNSIPIDVALFFMVFIRITEFRCNLYISQFLFRPRGIIFAFNKSDQHILAEDRTAFLARTWRIKYWRFQSVHTIATRKDIIARFRWRQYEKCLPRSNFPLRPPQVSWTNLDEWSLVYSSCPLFPVWTVHWHAINVAIWKKPDQCHYSVAMDSFVYTRLVSCHANIFYRERRTR